MSDGESDSQPMEVVAGGLRHSRGRDGGCVCVWGGGGYREMVLPWIWDDPELGAWTDSGGGEGVGGVGVGVGGHCLTHTPDTPYLYMYVSKPALLTHSYTGTLYSVLLSTTGPTDTHMFWPYLTSQL